jgi:hypothetical protein
VLNHQIIVIAGVKIKKSGQSQASMGLIPKATFVKTINEVLLIN